MRLRLSAMMMTTGVLLAGCMNKPAVNLGGPPNPYNYMKVSGLCHTDPLASTGKDTQATTMQVRSDDGYCAVEVRKPDGHAYASFGVSPAPEHGKAFIYNYNDHTYVTYTANTAYTGNDTFRVQLIRGEKEPRDTLNITAHVEAPGVGTAAK